MALHSFPAGMEPLGSERHGRSPKGELSGESESIEVRVNELPEESQSHWIHKASPAGIEPTSKV